MTTKHGILHLIDPSQPYAGDEVTALARGLSRDYYEVTVAGPLPPYFRQRLSQQQVRWVNLPLPATSSLIGCGRAARQVKRLLDSKPIDLIHAHTLPATLTALLACRGRQMPIMATLHEVDGLTDQGGVGSWVRRRVIQWTLTHCSRLIVHSRAEQALLQSAFPQVAEAADVVYPVVRSTGRGRLYDVGAQRRHLGLHGAAAIVGILGFPAPEEVIRSLLEAAAEVGTQLPNIEFAIIGAGSQKSWMKQVAHDLGISGACVFLGNQRDVAQLVLAVNLVVLLTDASATPTYGLQALAADIPVIAANSEALVEILGTLPMVQLVDPCDAPAMTAAMMALLETVPGDDSEYEAVSATGVRLRSEDVLVSLRSYDLHQKWSASPARGAVRASAAQAVLNRYGVQRLVREVEALYHQALQ